MTYYFHSTAIKYPSIFLKQYSIARTYKKMLEMTVIISAFPYTSIKYFTYHLDSFLELQVLQNYSSDIFHIFRNDIFNFELSFTEEIIQIHQL